MDVVIRNANLVDGQRGVDIAIEHGRIAAIGPKLAVTAENCSVIDDMNFS